MAEITNNVASILYWDILLMGFSFLLITGAGLIFVVMIQKKYTIKEFDWLISKQIRRLRKVNISIIILLGLVVLVFVFNAGIIVNSLSDKWIDMKPCYHLQLKKLWLYNTCYSETNTDDSIKHESYRNIFNDYPLQESDILKAYYHMKNILWGNDVKRKYILHSQTMINISRAWCLTWFFAGLILMIGFLLLFKNYKVLSRKVVYFYILCIFVSFVFYYLGGLVWVNSEEEINNKIFSMYKSYYTCLPIFEQIY